MHTCLRLPPTPPLHYISSEHPLSPTPWLQPYSCMNYRQQETYALLCHLLSCSCKHRTSMSVFPYFAQRGAVRGENVREVFVFGRDSSVQPMQLCTNRADVTQRGSLAWRLTTWFIPQRRGRRWITCVQCFYMSPRTSMLNRWSFRANLSRTYSCCRSWARGRFDHLAVTVGHCNVELLNVTLGALQSATRRELKENLEMLHGL